MNRSEFDDIISKITECVIAYEKAALYDNKITLYLANGDKLYLRFPRNNIPHLLGVNLDYLKLSNKFPKNLSSFELLKFFLENSYNFANLIFQEKKLSSEHIFSKHINEKLNSFWENLHIKTNDQIAVIKYDKEKTYQIEESAENSNYYIIRKNNGKYHVLGILNNEEKGFAYIPTTIRQYDDFYEFDKYMTRIANKQDFTYINNEEVDNESKNYHSKFPLPMDSKIVVLDNLINMSKRYSATVSVANDLLFSLKRSKIKLQNEEINRGTLSLLNESIKEGRIFENNEEEIQLTSSPIIIELIEQCNNLICSNKGKDSINYTKITEENKILSNDNQSLIDENKTLKQELEQIKAELLKTKSEKNIYEEQLQIYEEAHNKVLSLKKSI